MILAFAQETKTITKTVVSYNSEITWVVAVLVLAWVLWFLLQRYLRMRAMRRKPRRQKRRSLKNSISVKNELSSNWLKKGKSKRIHAIGIGLLENGDNCIQIFINDEDRNVFEDSPDPVPFSYKGIPLVLIEMPQAVFISGGKIVVDIPRAGGGVGRQRQEVIMGGISGANTNLNNECGTIGYFVRRKSFLPRRADVLLLSNSHVFVDLKKMSVDEQDLIMQPSPGEAGESRAIGELIDFAKLKFDQEAGDVNHIDAAVAKLWKKQTYQPLIPTIGAVKGFVRKEDVELGEVSRKFGRTTGHTQGTVYSIHLDILIKYARTGQEAFFKDQFLIKPDENVSEKFVEKGDSGSLVVDENNYATGLIFAGGSGGIKAKDLGFETVTQNKAMITAQIDNYGVANPISEVLSKLQLELLPPDPNQL